MKIVEYFKNQKEDKNFNLLPDGIFTIEQDGKITSVNDKVLKIFNTSKFNILGHYFSDFVENGTAVLNKITKDGSSAYVKAFANKPKENEDDLEEEKQNSRGLCMR